nr:sulfite exporter TauE/SafE family protein [Pseudomonadota bacterium]
TLLEAGGPLVGKGGAVGAVLGTFIGAQVAGLLKSGWLAMFFAVFVGLSALRMLLSGHAPAADGPESLPPKPALMGAGSLIGFISSLVGAGGGFLTVPFLSWRGVHMRNAVATSAAMGFPIAAGGLVGYVLAGQHASGLPPYSLGFVYLPALFACAATSVLMAPVGASVAHRLHVQSLRRVFAVLLLGLASYMLWKGVHALSWIAP